MSPIPLGSGIHFLGSSGSTSIAQSEHGQAFALQSAAHTEMLPAAFRGVSNPTLPAGGFMWMMSVLGSIFPLGTKSIQLLSKCPCKIGCIKLRVSYVSSPAGTEILNQLFIFFIISLKRRHFQIISILVNCRLERSMQSISLHCR